MHCSPTSLYIIYTVCFLAIAANFGYPLKQFSHELAPNEFINELEKQFDVVLIGDYVEESLVVLKNTLCWSLNDVAFISTKKEDFYPDIPHQLKVTVMRLFCCCHCRSCCHCCRCYCCCCCRCCYCFCCCCCCCRCCYCCCYCFCCCYFCCCCRCCS